MIELAADAVYRRTCLIKSSGTSSKLSIRTVALAPQQVLGVDDRMQQENRADDSLSFLDLEVLFIQHLWREVVGNHFPLLPPCRIGNGGDDVVSFAEQLSNVIGWPVGIYFALLVQQVMDGFAITKNHHIRGAQFQRVYAAVLLCPSAEPAEQVMSVFLAASRAA